MKEAFEADKRLRDLFSSKIPFLELYGVEILGGTCNQESRTPILHFRRSGYF